jgi:cytochrome c556
MMKRMTLAIIMTLLLIATGCGKAKAETAQEQFHKKTATQIEEMQKKIDELKAKSSEKFHEEMAELQKKEDAAKQEFEEMKAATGAAWDKAKTKISGTVEDLEKSYERAKAHFK